MIRLTPPMGWNTWNTFAENIDESLLLESADAMISSGLKDMGYDYIVMDDCWSEPERDKNGRIVPLPGKFPHGIKYISDYMHERGLKFGMYSCAGNMTCAGYPASFEHEFIDAETFAEWGVDFLKYDYCYKPYGVPGHILYKRMGNALASCGRDILFSACSWGSDSTEEWINTAGAHMWRSTGDIFDTWKSVKEIHSLQVRLQPFNKMNCFNDMDMLIVGMNGRGNVGLQGCTFEEYKTHFSLWAILNSPLMIGCDIRGMDAETKRILMNKEVIAINQDPSQRQPFLCGQHPWPDSNEDYVWVKQLDGGDFAIGFFNMGDKDISMDISLFDIGLGRISGRTLEFSELWSGEKEFAKNDVFCKKVKAHQCLLYRARQVRS